MKVLHLFSNWRWTGPAEPALNLATALMRRGMDVTFVFGQTPRGLNPSVLAAIEQRGVPTRTDFQLHKHFAPIGNLADARLLRRWLADEPVDIVHAHMRNAHVVAALGTRRLERKPLLVRTCYHGDGPRGQRERVLLKRSTDGLIVVSDRARDAVVAKGFPQERVWKVHTAIDLARFDPDRGIGQRREELGIESDAFVVGIVARVQWRRRFHVFLDAIARAHRELPSLRAVIVGRGTNIKPIAIDPVHKMGLDRVVLFPGYHSGDDYVRTLASMDVKVYLVPGTDGSCRAVREAMAMGVPVIAARRGMLPELVADGERGLVIDDTPENLARGILELAHDRQRRAAMAQRARQYAREHFGLDRQAEIVGKIYRELADRRGV